MKKNIRQITYSWLLLLCFIAGQYMVFAHQHFVNKHNSHAAATKGRSATATTLSEKCSVCDSMHHVAMDLTTQVNYTHIAVSSFIYRTFQYDFKSIALVHTPGRAPPVIS